MTWTAANGDLWLFGGFAVASGYLGYMNDLWRYDGTNWTWVRGWPQTNHGGTMGTLGVPSPSNDPAARAGAVTWADTNGNFWLLGGAPASPGYAFDDFWKLTPN
jgi:hypothetical protein